MWTCFRKLYALINFIGSTRNFSSLKILIVESRLIKLLNSKKINKENCNFLF